MNIQQLFNADWANYPWSQDVDLYCERLLPGTGAEPVNLYSSFAFIVAIYFSIQFGKGKSAIKGAEIILMATMVLIAIGSVLFHSFGTVWAMYADLTPIYAFQILFVYHYSKFIGRNRERPWILAMIMVTGYIGMSVALTYLPTDSFYGAIAYFPTLLFLICFAFYHNHNVTKNTAAIWLSVIFLVIALVMQLIDIEACEFQRFGTHAVWHVCAAVAMYFAMLGLMTTRIDGRYFRSKSIKGHYQFFKKVDIEDVEDISPHEAVEFDDD